MMQDGRAHKDACNRRKGDAQMRGDGEVRWSEAQWIEQQD